MDLFIKKLLKMDIIEQKLNNLKLLNNDSSKEEIKKIITDDNFYNSMILNSNNTNIIRNIVCSVLKINYKLLEKKSRDRNFVYGRILYCFFYSVMFGKNYNSMRFLAQDIKRDRTTILYYIDRHEINLNYEDYKAWYDEIVTKLPKEFKNKLDNSLLLLK